jgi:hypothetical protein
LNDPQNPSTVTAMENTDSKKDEGQEENPALDSEVDDCCCCCQSEEECSMEG